MSFVIDKHLLPKIVIILKVYEKVLLQFYNSFLR